MTAPIKDADKKLDALAAGDERVTRLRTIPQVGARLAELVVTTLDDAKRFRTARQVSSYARLTRGHRSDDRQAVSRNEPTGAL